MAGEASTFDINRRQFLVGAAAAMASTGFALIPTTPAEAQAVANIAVGTHPEASAAGLSPRLRFVERPEFLPAPPAQLAQDTARLLKQLSEEAFALVRLKEANARFPGIDGWGTAVAVIDTGIRPTHSMFDGNGSSRIMKERNFSAENGGWADDAWDTHGHGTHIAGLIAGREIEIDGFTAGGVAPAAQLVAIKILDRNGAGDLDVLARSLTWLRQWNDNSGRPLTAVNLSLGDPGNYGAARDALHRNQLFRTISREINRLTRQDVVVVCAAGNAYHYYQAEGLAFPAIMQETVSVGAVFDSALGQYSHPSGLWSADAVANKITPYSQRLNVATNPSGNGNTTFAPGTHLISASHLSDNGLATLQGTSQAAPIVTGAVLLAQQLYRNTTSRLPDPADVRSWLLQSTTVTVDDGNDSVFNTGKTYPALDVEAFLMRAEAAANAP